MSREVASSSVTSYGFGEETLVAGEGFHGCGLADRGRAGRTLTLQFVDGADQSGISESVSESPPGHGMRLGDSVGDQYLITEVRSDLQQTRDRSVAEVDLVVDLVDQHTDMGIGLDHFGEGLQLLAGVHRSGGGCPGALRMTHLVFEVIAADSASAVRRKLSDSSH